MKKIYLASPHMSDEGFELEYIKEAFETNWISPVGANIDAFEKDICEFTKSPYAVALNSGASALHFALKLAGVREGDIVFCQSNTYVATANAILYVGAIPVFIDSELETWNLSPEYLEEAFSKYPNAKAVLVVHIYGMSAKMDEIKAICKKYGAKLIEDAAESLGTFYKGKHTGTIGDYGILSFNGNKIITTSTGGMLLTKNKDEMNIAKKWSLQSKEPSKFFEHHEVGYTYRMSNILAGIGRGQMKILKDRIQKKKYINNYYKEKLKDITEIEFMPTYQDCDSNFWLNAILVHGDKVSVIDIMNALEKENIESRLAWKPMHLQPLFNNNDYIGSKNAESIFKNGICLPSDTKLTDTDLDRIINIIKGLFYAKKENTL